MRWFFYWINCMKDFILNFTRILESNAKVYWSIIIGIVGCLALFVAEAIHVGNILAALNTKDQVLMKTTIDPIADIYFWARIILLIVMVIWANVEYIKTKKKLGLK